MKSLKELAELGKKMREKQSEYFRTRSSIALTESKKLERDFDKAVKDIVNPEPETIPVNQLNLL